MSLFLFRGVSLSDIDRHIRSLKAGSDCPDATDGVHDLDAQDVDDEPRIPVVKSGRSASDKQVEA